VLDEMASMSSICWIVLWSSGVAAAEASRHSPTTLGAPEYCYTQPNNQYHLRCGLVVIYVLSTFAQFGRFG
jgi:hypothetical protein